MVPCIIASAANVVVVVLTQKMFLACAQPLGACVRGLVKRGLDLYDEDVVGAALKGNV
jgi:hypothetical protein